MTPASPKERAQAYAVCLVALALVLSPLVRHPDEDSFPLSTFPMFSHERPRSVWVTHAVAISAHGDRTPLSPDISAGTSEPLQSMRTIELAVQAGRAPELCAEIADRLTHHAHRFRAGVVQVETIAFDAVAYFSDAPPLPRIHQIHARCQVRP